MRYYDIQEAAKTAPSRSRLGIGALRFQRLPSHDREGVVGPDVFPLHRRGKFKFFARLLRQTGIQEAGHGTSVLPHHLDPRNRIGVAHLTGSILQINVSRGGVPKRPIPQADVTVLGIAGDEHAHPRIHGGPRKALLWMASEGIDELIARGFPLYYGALGENITTRGLDRRWFRAGQRYRVGEIMIELTTPRVPCRTLDVYGEGIQEAIYDPEIGSPRYGLSGFYASVIRAGTIRAGDPIQLLEELA